MSKRSTPPKGTDEGQPSPPAHLSDESRDWFASVAAGYVLEPWQIRTLTAAAESHDRMTEARRLIEADGMVVESRFGEKRAHPAVAIERDSRTAYLRALRELALDVAPPDTRPVRRGGQRW